MAKLAKDRIHHHATIRIVLGAEQVQRPRRLRPHIGAIGWRRNLLDCVREDAEAKSRPVALFFAADVELAAHRLRKAPDEREPKAWSAKRLRNFRAALCKGTEELLHLAGADADAVVHELKDEAYVSVSGLFGGGAEPHHAFRRELHRVVSKVLQGGAQADGIARNHGWEVGRDADFGLDPFVAGAPRKRGCDGIGQRARGKGLVTQYETASVWFDRIDDKRCQRGEMIGTAPDRTGPFAFPRGQIGGSKQLRERHYSGERGPDIVRNAGESHLDCARADPVRTDIHGALSR